MDDQHKQLINLKINPKDIIKTDRWKYRFSKKEILFREKSLIRLLKKLLNIFKKNNINYFLDGSSFWL